MPKFEYKDLGGGKTQVIFGGISLGVIQYNPRIKKFEMTLKTIYDLKIYDGKIHLFESREEAAEFLKDNRPPVYAGK